MPRPGAFRWPRGNPRGQARFTERGAYGRAFEEAVALTDVRPTFAQIRERAYELWERNHRPDGMEIELWLMAERELRNELQKRRQAEKADDAATAVPEHEAS